MAAVKNESHTGRTEVSSASEASQEESLVSLILRANSVVRPTILAARKLEGLSLMEARLMRRLWAGPGRKLEDVMSDLLLGASASADLVKDMQKRDLVSLGSNGELSLTKLGSERFGAVLHHARTLEAVELAGIPEEDLKTAKRVLGELIKRHAAAPASPGQD